MVLPSLTPVELMVVVATALLGYTGLASPLFGTRHARYSALVATAASIIVSAMLYRLVVERGPLHLFHGSMVVDGFGALLVFASSLSLFFDIVAAVSVVERWDTGSAFYAISALTLLGVYAVALGVNLALIYAAWILAAVSSYVIIALWKNDIAAEAAAKYAVMGVISTSLLIYALTFAVGASGSIYYTGIKPVALVAAGAAVLLPLAAVGFKMGVVPFHMWLPDVYGNARPFLVSVVASQAKLIAVAFLVRLLYPMAVANPGLVHVLAGMLAAATSSRGLQRCARSWRTSCWRGSCCRRLATPSQRPRRSSCWTCSTRRAAGRRRAWIYLGGSGGLARPTRLPCSWRCWSSWACRRRSASGASCSYSRASRG